MNMRSSDLMDLEVYNHLTLPYHQILHPSICWNVNKALSTVNKRNV